MTALLLLVLVLPTPPCPRHAPAARTPLAACEAVAPAGARLAPTSASLALAHAVAAAPAMAGRAAAVPVPLVAAPSAERLRRLLADGARAAPDPWLGVDKFQHFFMGFAVTSVAYGLARMAVDHRPAVGAAIAAGALAGIGKEIHDARAGSDASLRDLTWDAIGIGVGSALVSQIR